MKCNLNSQTKAMQAFLAKEKKTDARALLEYDMAFQTNSNRGHVFNQSELLANYDRRGQAHGASKAVHILASDGEPFKYIVLKRLRNNPYIPHNEGTGNQLKDEASFWNAFADKPEADFLCPTLRIYETKSDHNCPTSNKALHNIVAISQKAVDNSIGNLREACYTAERLNIGKHIRHGESAEHRYEAMRAFAADMHWRDVIYNGGNSGVIWDYEKGCYKAVFIDYAL